MKEVEPRKNIVSLTQILGVVIDKSLGAFHGILRYFTGYPKQHAQH